MGTFLRYFIISFSVNSRNGTSAKLDFLHKGEPHPSKMMGNIEQANLFLSSIVPINHSLMEKDFKDTLIIPLPEFHWYQILHTEGVKKKLWWKNISRSKDGFKPTTRKLEWVQVSLCFRQIAQSLLRKLIILDCWPITGEKLSWAGNWFQWHYFEILLNINLLASVLWKVCRWYKRNKKRIIFMLIWKHS